jgi:cell division protein FtsL
MTPTALTPAGRGTRPTPRHGAAKRQPAAPSRAATAAQGARTAAQGARTAAQGARTAAQGARTAVNGARTAAHGTRAVAQGARTTAQGARTAAQGARTVATSARTPIASGPAGGRGAGHRAPVRRSTAPRNPRRVSGPARRRPSDQPVVRAPLAARSAGFIRALPDHALLDRIIRGRYWIPLLGVLLVGIVAMQVEVLKLNAGIGRALEQSTSLQNRNEQLRAAVARGADDQRIESIAAHMGMVMPQPAAIRFLAHAPIANVGKAISSIHVPDATSFQAALTAAAGATSASASSTTSSVVTTPSTASSTSPGA